MESTTPPVQVWQTKVNCFALAQKPLLQRRCLCKPQLPRIGAFGRSLEFVFVAQLSKLGLATGGPEPPRVQVCGLNDLLLTKRLRDHFALPPPPAKPSTSNGSATSQTRATGSIIEASVLLKTLRHNTEVLHIGSERELQCFTTHRAPQKNLHRTRTI